MPAWLGRSINKASQAGVVCNWRNTSPTHLKGAGATGSPTVWAQHCQKSRAACWQFQLLTVGQPTRTTLPLISRIATFQRPHCCRISRGFVWRWDPRLVRLFLTFSFKQKLIFLRFDLMSVWFLKRGKVRFHGGSSELACYYKTWDLLIRGLIAQ